MDIITKINSRLDKLLFIQNNNDKVVLKPNICCICDELLKYNEVNYITQNSLEINKQLCCKWKRLDNDIDLNVKQQLISYYSYNGPYLSNWMSNRKEEYLISPRTCAVKGRDKFYNYNAQKEDDIEYIIC